jgi:hypothetical protein
MSRVYHLDKNSSNLRLVNRPGFAGGSNS